jgi:hypothetical protein
MMSADIPEAEALALLDGLRNQDATNSWFVVSRSVVDDELRWSQYNSEADAAYMAARCDGLAFRARLATTFTPLNRSEEKPS